MKTGIIEGFTGETLRVEIIDTEGNYVVQRIYDDPRGSGKIYAFGGLFLVSKDEVINIKEGISV